MNKSLLLKMIKIFQNFEGLEKNEGAGGPLGAPARPRPALGSPHRKCDDEFIACKAQPCHFQCTPLVSHSISFPIAQDQI